MTYFRPEKQKHTRSLNLSKSQLVKALKDGTVHYPSAPNLRVQFVYKNGIDVGYLTDSRGSVKHYRSDHAAWQEANNIMKTAGLGEPYN